MNDEAAPDIPLNLQRLCRRFERWRNSHQGRLPIPKSLWNAAAKMAREHGVFRAAKALHLEYGKLKRLSEAAPARRPNRNAPAAFLEFMPSQSGLSECLIELEGRRGKMRIQWKGTMAPDIAGLSRVLWEPA